MSSIRIHIPTTPRLHHLGLGEQRALPCIGFMKSSRNSYSSTTSWYPMMLWRWICSLNIKLPVWDESNGLSTIWARKSQGQDAEVLRFQSQSLLGPICLCSKNPLSLVAPSNMSLTQLGRKPFNTIPDGDKESQMENMWYSSTFDPWTVFMIILLKLSLFGTHHL